MEGWQRSDELAGVARRSSACVSRVFADGTVDETAAIGGTGREPWIDNPMEAVTERILKVIDGQAREVKPSR